MTGLVTVKTAAKLNLLLNITGVREDGYHTLETVMQTVDLYDFMTIDAAGGQIRLTGNLPYIPYNEKNLVYRAAAAFFAATGIPPAARIHLTKHIPVQAGMGGGSGNAAGALLGLNLLYGEPLSRNALAALAGPLGADVPYFLTGGTALCTGTGDELTPLRPMPDCTIVVIKDRQGVSTSAAYAKYDADPIPPVGDLKRLLAGMEQGGLGQICAGLGNVFYEYAAAQCPQIKWAYDDLFECGADGVCMSGSGSAVFGIFEDPDRARRCFQKLGRAHAYISMTRPTEDAVLLFEG